VDDLPLFSGTPATASDSPFMPEAAPEPDAPTVDMFSDPAPETHGAQWGGSSAEARVSFGTYYLINFETNDAVVSTRMEHGERLLAQGYKRVSQVEYAGFVRLREQQQQARPATYIVTTWEEAQGIIEARAAGERVSYGVGNTYPDRFNAVKLDRGAGYTLHSNEGDQSRIGRVVAYIYVRSDK
jgi:hypothetical protein